MELHSLTLIATINLYMVLSSNGVQISVKKPGETDRVALERLRGFPQAKFLARGTNCSAIADEFRVVLQRYPKSTYTPWCHYFLGRYYQFQPGGDDKARAINARLYYGALLRKFPEFPLKVELKYEMARELFRLEKADDAVYEIKRLAKFDPIANNRDTELFLLYEARRIIGEVEDGNQEKELSFLQLPNH